MVEARGEHEDCDDSEDAEDRAEDGRADRNRRRPAPGFKGHTHTGRRDGCHTGAARGVHRSCCLASLHELTEAPSTGRAECGNEREDQDPTTTAAAPSASTVPSRCSAEVGLGPASDADREQRRREYCADHRDQRSTQRDRQRLETTDRDVLAPGETQRPLRRLVGRGQRDLAAHHDRDRDKSRERSDTSEYPQRHHEHVDRVLGALRVDGEILSSELG